MKTVAEKQYTQKQTELTKWMYTTKQTPPHIGNTLTEQWQQFVADNIINH